MLESGVLLLFLVPGLLTYCAIYGLFHSGKTIAPQPPAANSFEAVTVILLASIVVHGATALGVVANGMACAALPCPLLLPPGASDPYGLALDTIHGRRLDARNLAVLLLATLAQGGLMYGLVRWRLAQLAWRDALPNWIYGWSTDIANSADNDDTSIVAFVLTTIDVADKAVVYGGTLYDMALASDGAITRITLFDCERYLIDLAAREDPLPRPLSRIPLMSIDAANIRNVAFDTFIFGDPAGEPALA